MSMWHVFFYGTGTISMLWTVEYDKAPKLFLISMVINSPLSQKFMISKIFSAVSIFLDPLMDEFTLMESKIFIIMEYAQQRKSLLETMNS